MPTADEGKVEPVEETKTEDTEEKKPVAAEAATETKTEEEPDGYEDIRDYLREVEGFDASKYKSPEEAIKGLVATARKVGERDEDANYGRALKQLVAGREAELAAYLKGAKPEEKRELKSLERFDYDDFHKEYGDEPDTWVHQVTRDEKGNLIPVGGANPEIVSKFLAYQNATSKRLREVLRDYPKLARAPEEIKEELRSLAGSSVQAQEETAVNQLVAQYPIYSTDGGKQTLTEFGQQVEDEYKELSEAYPDASRLQHLRKAIKTVMKERDEKAVKTALPGKRVTRTAPVAQTAETYSSVADEFEKRLAKGESFSEIGISISRREQAKLK